MLLYARNCLLQVALLALRSMFKLFFWEYLTECRKANASFTTYTASFHVFTVLQSCYVGQQAGRSIAPGKQPEMVFYAFQMNLFCRAIGKHAPQ